MSITRKKKVLIFIVTFFIIFSIWVFWGNISIQTTRINISSEKIPAEFNGFTIVQVSDLHNAEFGSHQRSLLDAVKNASPDIIAVTGDLIDTKQTNVAKAMDFINGAVKIAPVYFVTGNHESWSEQYKELKLQMLASGVEIMEDESKMLKRAGGSIRLIGLNESLSLNDKKLKDLQGNSREYTILLSHRPEFFDDYAADKIDLVLSGHAHGGQFRLPVAGGLIAPDQGWFPKYYEGVYEKQQTKMVVSRGLGNSIIPIRFNNRPELVVVKLVR